MINYYAIMNNIQEHSYCYCKNSKFVENQLPRQMNRAGGQMGGAHSTYGVSVKLGEVAIERKQSCIHASKQEFVSTVLMLIKQIFQWRDVSTRGFSNRSPRWKRLN